ncbi:MAG: prenyltransferase/squalene oxidase repeat-containing protein, partial [Fimbriiglobus sp.]
LPMLRFTLLLLASLLLTTSSRADEKVKIDTKTKDAIFKALAYLKVDQQTNGSWGQSYKVAVTSYVLLAYMSNGHVPNQGVFGPEVAKGIRFLLSQFTDQAELRNAGGNQYMYSYGMATLALSQAYGMTSDEEVKKTLTKAVAIIVKTQNPEGGWRYEPAPTGADISVTIMQVMALRGAKDSGLNVPDETMKKAVAYINKCYDTNTGGYRYQPYSAGPGYARTAAGVCVLQLCGQYEAKQIARAVEWLENTKDDDNHYWYGHYYASHAMHQIGGKKWEDYYERMKTTLLKLQKPTGQISDHHETGVGPQYSTAIAVLMLSVPANYLPIYQR